MITQRYFERGTRGVLFRVAVADAAVMDVLTDDGALERCRAYLRAPAPPLDGERLGSFGPFEVSMSMDRTGDTVAIFIGGPRLGAEYHGDQCAGLYVGRDEMLRALDETSDFPGPDWE